MDKEKQQGFREDRFTWGAEDVKNWEWLQTADDEATESEEDSTICQGPFWPSPDDPNTGYCTCCQQVYQGDLLNHPCLSSDNEIGNEEEVKQ